MRKDKRYHAVRPLLLDHLRGPLLDIPQRNDVFSIQSLGGSFELIVMRTERQSTGDNLPSAGA